MTLKSLFNTSTWMKLGATLCIALLSQGAMAQQNWPNRPIKLIVGWSAGGSTDILARVLASELNTLYGVPVVVENKPGAAGSLAAKIYANAPMDDHALMVVPPGPVAINQFLYKSIGYDPGKDLASVAMLAQVPSAVTVRAESPLHSFKGLIEYAKANPDKLSYSSAGIGTTGNLLNELIKTETGVKILHVPYKGNGPAMQALLAGEVDMNTDGNPVLLTSVRAGKLRALAVSSAERWSALPDVPTFAELGYPQFTMQVMYGVVAQANMPKDIIEKLNKDLNGIVNKEAVKVRLKGLNLEVIPHMTADDMTKTLRRDRERWKKVVEASGAAAAS